MMMWEATWVAVIAFAGFWLIFRKRPAKAYCP